MAATLKDVAQRAGVSIKTVSNVVHGYAHVTDEVRKRVRAALEDLNYQPNLPARYLRNGRPHLIDGVILSLLALQPEDLQSRQTKTPLVLLGEHLLDVDVPYDHIANSNVAAARLATKHLLDVGRHRIASIGNHGELPIVGGAGGLRRLRGYAEALAAVGLPVDPQLIIQVTSYSRTEGARAMQQLLALPHPPDAVFCFNDLLALGAMRTLHEAGRRIPEDVAVVGFDDIEEVRFSIPSLTTIAPDKEKMGELAVSLLLERIDGTRTGPPERVEVPSRLIVRESTGSLMRVEKEREA